MAAARPRELVDLLDAEDAASIEAAWAAFVDRYSELILKAARLRASDYDGAMDRYQFVLEGLRSDDFRRLETYTVQSRSTFRSWLFVVSQRLCYDYERARFGRVRGTESPETAASQRLRRRVANLAGVEVDTERLPDSQADPEAARYREQCFEALYAALDDLERRDRLLLQLRFGEEMSVREIARSMGFPSIFHVYRRLKVVLEELRATLAERGVEGAE